jgi:hypothetical protein
MAWRIEEMAAEFVDIVPELAGDFDPGNLTGFHLDPLSEKVLSIVDGKATVRRIMDETGAEIADVEKILKLLKVGGLIKYPADYRMAEAAGGDQSSEDVLGTVPTRIPNIDVSGFHLDPLSRKIFECANGTNNVRQIAKKAGADAAAAVKTLNLLKGAGVIKYPAGIGQLHVPTPPPMAPPPQQTVEEAPEPEDNTQVKKLKSSIPSPAGFMDMKGFYFDPLSRKILEMIDGETSLGSIVKETGASIAEVEITLKLLNDGRLIKWSPEQQTARPRSSTPPFAGAKFVQPPGDPSATKSYSAQKIENFEGTLEEKNIESLVDEADMSSLTGSILCRRNNETVTFHFEDGEPKGVDTTSPLYGDFGAMLHRAGFIDTEMLKRFRTEFAKDSDAVQALRRAGIEDPKKMAQLVVWRGETLFREVLGWPEGSYTIAPGAPFPEKTARCRLKFITSGSSKTTAWRKGHLTEERNQFFSDKRYMYMVPTKRAAKLAARMGLDDSEKRYIKNVLEAAPLQLSKAMSISTLLKASTRKILLYLIENGGFELCETNPEEEPPIPLDDLESYRRKLDYENYFNILNAHAVSIVEEIRERYERRMREFENKRYPDAEPQHLAILAQIREHIEKAWSILKDETSRQEYRRKVYTQFQLDNFFQLQMEKAEAALSLRKNPREALPIAQSAWDLRPGHVLVKNILKECLTALGRKSEIGNYTAKPHDQKVGKKKAGKKLVL